jgi:hypothetical protein
MSSPASFNLDFDFLSAGAKYFPLLQPDLLTLHTLEEYHYAMVLWYYQEGLEHLLGDYNSPNSLVY